MFMVLSATAMILIFMVVFSELYQDNLSDKRAILAKDFGYSIQNEFIIAAEARPGYVRQFEIPQNLEGFQYEIYILNDILVVNYSDNIFLLAIPPVEGAITKGINTIQNQNNTICLNC